MTKINISPQKLLPAASHALIDAKAEQKELYELRKNASGSYSMYLSKYICDWYNVACRLECLLTAAKACDGIVCMSMEDVALVRKYL